MTTAFVCLLLFILNLAVALGAGLYEARIVLPLWFKRVADGTYLVNEFAMRQTDVGRRFWGAVTTLPLTVLTLVNLCYAFTTTTPVQGYWLAGTLLILLERIATFAFFIPAAISLQSAGNLSTTEKSRLASQWLRLNYLRNGATAAGMAFCLKAFLV